MTQRVFDVENEKDMADLWDILPDDYCRIEKRGRAYCFYKITCGIDHYESFANFFKINWHDRTEITRPIQEATEQDIGKLCAFWDYKEEIRYGRLDRIINQGKMTFYSLEDIRDYCHARRLTKQEIEELC
jgi:hypothetical protein